MGGDSGGLPNLLSRSVPGENGLLRIPIFAILVAEATWSHHPFGGEILAIAPSGSYFHPGQPLFVSRRGAQASADAPAISWKVKTRLIRSGGMSRRLHQSRLRADRRSQRRGTSTS